MKKKYIVVPGEVRSIQDGQIHKVGYRQLIRLYGVDPRECELWRWRWSEEDEAYFRRCNPDKIILKPREDGEYSIRVDGLQMACDIAMDREGHVL